MRTTLLLISGLTFAAAIHTAGCTKSGNGSNHDDGIPQQSQRLMLSAEECEARGGQIMGDPGDGRIHRPEYRCPNGKPPIGTVSYETGEMIPVEGSVCCPR